MSNTMIKEKIDAIDEEAVPRYSSITDTGNSQPRLRKCIRKGDIVCFTDEENIHMVNRKTQKHNSTKTTLDPQKSMERVRSGESLYKTFTFAQSLNDEDTEKCIAFWKSVMEKHLEPVKCHIVENREYQPAENFKEATYENEKNCEPEKKNEKVNIEDEVDEKLKLVHKEYRNMWDKAIKQLQKKKLDKIKLDTKSRCPMCQTLNTPFEENVCGNPNYTEKEIKDLNKWKSTSRKKTYATGTSGSRFVSRNQQEKKNQEPEQISVLKQGEKQRSSLGKTKKQSTNQSTTEVKKEQSMVEAPEKTKPPPDTNNYEFVDVIKEKQESGIYKRWRSNTVKGTCRCGYKICCCNTNPAIKSMIQSAVPTVYIDKDTKNTKTSLEIPLLEPPRAPTKSSLSMKSERIGLSKALSLLINCECSHESCDCKEELQMLSRTMLPKEEWEMPKPPKILPLEKRSSIEIYKEKLSLSDMHVARNISDSAVCQSYQQEHEPDGKDDDESESLSADRQSNIHPPSIANDEQAEMEETESSLSGKKTVSLLIPGCKRGEEDYDCVIVGEINKEQFPPEEYEVAEKVPEVDNKPFTKLENGLELTKSNSLLDQMHSATQQESPLPIESRLPAEATRKTIPIAETIPYEPDNLEVQESKIVVRKDSIQLTHDRSEINWLGSRKFSELQKDKQCYEQLGEKVADQCGKRERHQSISGSMATNANKLVKKISFSAKTCRCTNPRCDCYNVISSGNSNEYIESKTAVTDLEDETTYIGGSISREVSKERMLDHENGMKVIWSTKPGKDEKSILIDDSASLAASQFLEYTTAI